MKTLALFLSVFFVGVVAFSPAHGQAHFYSLAKSPDHPSTWVVGASNIHQDLRWNATQQMLVADVTYSTRDWADSMHPTHENEYTLAFPTVRLDKSSHTFVASETQVGTLKHGLFGPRVVLNPNAELDIHRHHGLIFAAIDPAER
jgi:hypothetical protein